MTEKSRKVPLRYSAHGFSVEYAGQKNSVWSLRLQEHEKLVHSEVPDVWAHIVAKFRTVIAGDIIEVRAHDNSMFARLFVRSAGATWLKVAIMEKFIFEDAPDLPKGSPLSVEWNIGLRKYAVVNKQGSDKVVVKDNFDLKEDAVNWINEHTKAMAA